MAFSRRDFLRFGTAGLALGTLAPMVRNPLFNRSLQAAMLQGDSPKKMLMFFLRGGMDSANALVPFGDTGPVGEPEHGYTDVSRPTIFVSDADGISLDVAPYSNDFALLHPDLQELVDEVPLSDLALCHRVGYQGQSRSHFTSQQYWENADPQQELGSLVEEGWVNRMIAGDPTLDSLKLPAASVSVPFQALFRGPRPLMHVNNLADYGLSGGTEDFKTKLLGAVPGTEAGTGMLGIYSRDPDSYAYDELVRGNGISLADSLDELQLNGVDPNTYTPGGGAVYPSQANQSPGDPFYNDFGAYNFFRQLKDAVQLLKETDCRVAGVELGGFDTHSNQEDGRYQRLMRIIARMFTSAYLDLDDGGFWDDTVIMMVSEFSRTSAENGSLGTDHGEAGCVFLAGGKINGGVYNCDSSTWALGDMFSVPTNNPRYIAQNTDFRALLSELVTEHFEMSNAQRDDILPGFDVNTGGTTDELDIYDG